MLRGAECPAEPSCLVLQPLLVLTDVQPLLHLVRWWPQCCHLTGILTVSTTVGRPSVPPGSQPWNILDPSLNICSYALKVQLLPPVHVTENQAPGLRRQSLVGRLIHPQGLSIQTYPRPGRASIPQKPSQNKHFQKCCKHLCAKVTGFLRYLFLCVKITIHNFQNHYFQKRHMLI